MTEEEEVSLAAENDVLKDFYCATKELQKDSCNLSQAYHVFQALVEDHRVKYPGLDDYLGEGANIIQNKLFESGIRKIQIGKEGQLTVAETIELTAFEVEIHDNVIDLEDHGEGALSFAERLAKRYRTDEVNGNGNGKSKYRPCLHVKPTSNSCERLFSAAKLVITDHRSRMLPCQLEIVLYLKKNESLWDVADIEWLLQRNPALTVGI